MAWTESDIPDLAGRTAVVTGANGGLGFQTALALAGVGAHVVLAARDPSKTAAAEARLRERYPSASLEVVPLDLGDLSVVASPYSAGDRVVGAVGVIGPTRMNYQRVIPLVSFTAEVLSGVLEK